MIKLSFSVFSSLWRLNVILRDWAQPKVDDFQTPWLSCLFFLLPHKHMIVSLFLFDTSVHCVVTQIQHDNFDFWFLINIKEESILFHGYFAGDWKKCFNIFTFRDVETLIYHAPKVNNLLVFSNWMAHMLYFRNLCRWRDFGVNKREMSGKSQ